ncbi:hypothetical protein [Haloactinopolyspora alba]|nr:hypothetical protein [Haloactinopolyspora alba]
MDALGLTATTYIIADRVDSDPDTVTSADLADAVASGWEIGGHAYSGVVHGASYEGVTTAEAQADMAELRDWLATNYPDPGGHYNLAYPHGRYGATADGNSVESLTRKAGFRSGRTILASVGSATHLQVAGVPEVMPYRIHAASSISELSGDQLNPDNLVAAGGMLDKTASNDAAWMNLVFHQIVDDQITTNLHPNPGFETDTSDWFVSAATLERSTVQAHDGAASGLVTPDASGTVTVSLFNSVAPAVTVGMDYTVAVWLYAPNGVDGVELRAMWLDDARAFLSSDTIQVGTLPAGEWVEGRVTASAPASAAFLNPGVLIGGTPAASDLLYIDDMRAGPGDQAPINSNAEFVSDVAGWAATAGGTLAWSSTAGGSAEVTPSGSVTPIEMGQSGIAATEGRAYHIEATGFVDVLSPRSVPTSVVFWWYDAQGNPISSDQSAQIELGPAVQTFSFTATAPAGAATMGVRIRMDDTPASDEILYVTYFRVSTPAVTATTQISKSDFDMVMDAIASRSLKVRTLRDALDRHVASITPTIDGPWLKSVTRPFLNRPIRIATAGEVAQPARGGVFDVVGRSLPVAVTDLRGSRSYNLSVYRDSIQDAREFDFILAAGDVMLLQIPPDYPEPDVPTGYFFIGDTSKHRVGVHSGLRRFVLPLTEVAPPAPQIVANTMTWNGLIEEFGSWADVVASFDSWADVLDYIATPAAVIIP